MIEYHVEGADSMMLRIRGVGEEVRDDILEAIGEALRLAEVEMKLNVPVDEGALFNSIKKGHVEFHPGGPGGGGFYEAELSAGEGVEHTRFVTEGTGVFGPRGGVITPTHGNVFPISKHGEPVRFRPRSEGQKPQTHWIEAAEEVANRVIEERLRRI